MKRNTSPLFDKDPDSGGSGDTGSAGGESTDWKGMYEASVAEKTKSDAEWNKRLSNLSATFQKEKLGHDEARSKLGELEKSFTEKEKSLSEYSAKHESLAKDLETTKSELQKKQSDLSRKQLIMSKYPHLAQFETDGLLPVAEEDKLDEILGKFSDNLGKVREDAKKVHTEGGVPPAPPSKSSGVRSSKEALADANRASSQGNGTDFTKFYAEYVTLVQKGL